MPDHLPSPYRPEADLVAACLRSLQGALDWPAAARVARPWVAAVRQHPPPFWAMESLLKEYPISSAEGLALMRLAEALLRVPDVETAITLTADQLGRADFDVAGSPGDDGAGGHGAMARLSSAAIGLSRHFLPQAGAGPDGAGSGLMARLGARTVVSATLRAVQLLGRQFVLGQTITQAMGEARAARQRMPALTYSYDMLGEGARTEADAQRYLQSYAQALAELAAQGRPDLPPEQRDGISIKLSALHPRYEHTQRERVLSELVPRVWGLCEQAARAGLNLTIDAEEVDRLELSLDVFGSLAERVAREHPQWRGFGLAMQAYQGRAPELMQHIIALARRLRLRFMCRLVKGAYWDAEIKRAQDMGLPHYPVYTHKAHTDICYLACARALLAAPDAVYPQFATHNAGTIAAIGQMAQAARAPYELQRLHGMGEGIYREVLQDPQLRCRVYAPVGRHRDLLAYLVRRLLENGANSSFVHQLADESVGMDELLASPLPASPLPALGQPTLPLPRDIFGPSRANSAGLDLAVAGMREPLLAAYAQTHVPQVREATLDDVTQAMRRAHAVWPAWNATPVDRRARMLRDAADALERRMPQFCALLVREGAKTWGDTVAEVREAIDFLRYYAHQAQRALQPLALPEGGPGLTGERNTLTLTGRGAWVCISPWNFPLAIFIGQVAAALVTGNTVVAKPAEQTPGVAQEAVRLLHAAGVPADVLQLLHGPGETIGAALVAQPQVAGVVFTGSTQVARIIQRTLAARDGQIVPLIAETGGINAMLVDSTALPEQVCDAVMASAFRSAGQRCSALRLLCLHEAVADGMLDMIRGAVAQLRVGDPAELATDVGPVIDDEASAGIRRHIAGLDAGLDILAVDARAGMATTQPDTGRHIAPRVYELPAIADLREEIFGPVLHVVRWRGDPGAVIDQINAMGWGLTLGIHTRIDSRAQALAERARVGNVYVNRNIIGAVVGLQPFGGEGLSGTGPKAGGPHYLHRFCAERTVTINTTAAGGNVALMTGG